MTTNPSDSAVTVIVAAALTRDNRVLVQQRAYPAEMAGQWELPGGRVEPDESETEALRRECVEELGSAVVVGERVGEDLPLRDGNILKVFAARLAEATAEPRAVEHRALRWCTAEELVDLDWLPADRVLIPVLQDLVHVAAGISEAQD